MDEPQSIMGFPIVVNKDMQELKEGDIIFSSFIEQTIYARLKRQMTGKRNVVWIAATQEGADYFNNKYPIIEQEGKE